MSPPPTMLPCYRDATGTYLIGTARTVRIILFLLLFCFVSSALLLSESSWVCTDVRSVVSRGGSPGPACDWSGVPRPSMVPSSAVCNVKL